MKIKLFLKLAVLVAVVSAVGLGSMPAQPANAAAFTNASAITILDGPTSGVRGFPASLYPSRILVSGMPGTITGVTVTLNGFSHGAAANLGLNLVGPQGQSLNFWNGNAGNVASPITFSIATTGTPFGGYANGVTYAQTFNISGAPYFPAPAPSLSPDGLPTGASDGTLSHYFNGTVPNGFWSLYVIDNAFNAIAGSISGGWTITITTNAAGAYWTKFPGQVRDVGVGGSGEVWAIGSNPAGPAGNFGIWQFNSGTNNWTQKSGSGVRIAVDSTGIPWVVNAAGQVWQLNPSTLSSWILYPGPAAQDIAAGGGSSFGRVWVVGTDQRVRYLDINNNNWVQISGMGTRITVDGRGEPWVTNAAFEIYRHTSDATPNGFWTKIPGQARDIGSNAAAPWSSIWVIGNTPQGQGFQIYSWDGVGWNLQPGTGTEIAIGGQGNPGTQTQARPVIADSSLEIWSGPHN